MSVHFGRPCWDGHDQNNIAMETKACLFTIAHFAFCGDRLFAPNGANPCDNLHLELRLFDVAQ
jgi:hypothetical protein